MKCYWFVLLACFKWQRQDRLKENQKTWKGTKALQDLVPSTSLTLPPLSLTALQLHWPASCFSFLTSSFPTWGLSNCSSLCQTIQGSPNQNLPPPHIKHLFPTQPPLLPKIKFTDVFAHLLSPCISSKCSTRVRASILPCSPLCPQNSG